MSAELPDVVVLVIVAVAAYMLSDVWYDFTGSLSSTAGPLSELLLSLVVPAVLIGLVISLGVSARRRSA
jgi:hypothetical protein